MKNALLVRRAVEDGEELQAALRTRGSSENVVCEILDKNRMLSGLEERRI